MTMISTRVTRPSTKYNPHPVPRKAFLFDSQGVRTQQERYLYEGPGHDHPGLLWRTLDADGAFTEYGYDSAGRISTVTDPDGGVTRYTYDCLGRQKSLTDPGAGVTRFAYDAHGNLNSVKDAIGNTTTYLFDDMGRRVSSVSPDTGAISYGYDEAGNQIRKTDARGATVIYAYDPLNRLTWASFPVPEEDIRFSYDAGPNGKGRRTGMSDPSGETRFGYDDRGRLVEKISTLENIAYATERAFTPGGAVSAITYPSGRTVNYDRQGCACKVSRITTSLGTDTGIIMSDLTYRPFGGLAGVQSAGGTVAHQYDENGRIRVSNPGAPHERRYDYDHRGNLTTVSSQDELWAYRSYTYDAQGRLKSAIDNWGSTYYTYDAVGNRLSDENNDLPRNYAYTPGTNRLKSATGRNPAAYAHDENGNITEIANRRLIYNADNRLVRVEENNLPLGEYTYNGLGQRIIKKAGNNTTLFHYDFEGNIIAESDLDGNTLSEYTYKGSSRLAMVDVPNQNTIYFYGNDALGTPQLMTGSAKQVVWQAKYDAFGEARVQTAGAVTNNFRFAGQYFDAETGLHYNYHRYYDPKTGRYLTADPIGLNGGINLFTYVQNNPVNLIDPFGLWSPKIHNRIIASAFPNLPSNLIQAIETGSEFADSSEFQSIEYGYMHSMRGPEESSIDACNKMQDYIKSYMNMYRSFLASGQLTDAYFALGMALHPIMDSTSPSHRGFQVWKGVWDTSGYDFFTHGAAEKNINNSQIQQSVKLINGVLIN